MARDEAQAVPAVLADPQISIVGEIGADTVGDFRRQLAEAEKDGGDIALEVTTLGGDAEMARRLMLEIDEARARLAGRFLFLGKTVVYSAGTTIMSAFPRRDRWLAPDAMLMIHCRKLDKTLEISGPIRASLPEAEALCVQMKTGLQLEREHFQRLIEGSDVSFDEIHEKALYNWYLTAEEAVVRGLAAGIYRPAQAGP